MLVDVVGGETALCGDVVEVVDTTESCSETNGAEATSFHLFRGERGRGEKGVFWDGWSGVGEGMKR